MLLLPLHPLAILYCLGRRMLQMSYEIFIFEFSLWEYKPTNTNRRNEPNTIASRKSWRFVFFTIVELLC